MALATPAEYHNSFPFSLSVGRALGTVVVTTHGDLDAQGSEHLGHTLLDLIEDQGNMIVIVDLRDMEDSGAADYSVFGKAVAAATRHGADLTLSRPTASVRRRLDARGLASSPLPTS